MTETNAIRIVVADDHPMVRDGLTRLLESEPGFRVVGQASDGMEAVNLARELRPDILLLDLSMPRSTGLDALKALSKGDSPSRAIVLTAGGDQQALVNAVLLGARGIVLKDSTSALLFKSIRCVMADEYWLGRENVADVVQALQQLSKQLDAHAGKKKFGLTRRELQVVAAAAAGDSNKEISARLKVSEDTVKHHLSNIFDKLGVFSRVELAVFAVNHSLTSEDAIAS